MSAINSITSVGVNACKKFANCGLVRTIAKEYEKDNRKCIETVAMTSIILKDALGCYMYVTQSLNNKKIPEEKRGFVAALDLANGGLMIAAQLLAFKTISNPKIQAKMFNALFGKTLNRSFRKGVIDKLSQNPIYKDLGKTVLNENYAAFKKSAVNAFGITTSLVASSILAKRVFVPFIATPLATYLKDNFLNKGKKEETISQDSVCQKSIDKNLKKYTIDNFTNKQQ